MQADMHLQVDKIDALETQHGWREEDFDFVLQFLRTVLMKRKNPLSLSHMDEAHLDKI